MASDPNPEKWEQVGTEPNGIARFPVPGGWLYACRDGVVFVVNPRGDSAELAAAREEAGRLKGPTGRGPQARRETGGSWYGPRPFSDRGISAQKGGAASQQNRIP